MLGPCLLSLAILGCAGFSPPSRPAPTTTTTTTAATATAAASEPGPVAEVVSLTNERRAAAGCDPVVPQDQLGQAAQLHAEDMAANHYFDHHSQDGRAPWDRAREQAYSGRGIGENIARGYPSAEAVVEAWMASSGHRTNIENCAWRDIGIGYEAGTHTWVQLFGA